MAEMHSKLVDQTRKIAEEHLYTIQRDIRSLLRCIALLARINLAVGIVSIVFFFFDHKPSLLEGGILSSFTYWLLMMKIRYAKGSKNMLEIGVTMICGFFLPMFILWISSSALFAAFVK